MKTSNEPTRILPRHPMKPKSKPRIAKPSPRQPVNGARVMWAQGGVGEDCTILVKRQGHPDFSPWVPVLVLDLSPEARERRVAIAKKAVETGPAFFTYEQVVRAVLASIGDTPANEGREK